MSDNYVSKCVSSKQILIKRKELMPLIVKYLPISFDEIISQNHVVSNITKFIKKKSIPHLLFYGMPGTGKTSTINALLEILYGENKSFMAMEVNSSSERGIETVRKDIKSFISIEPLVEIDDSITTKKMVILDEVDSMTKDAQQMLRKLIEDYTNNVTFCLICNEIQQVIMPIQSRCLSYKFGLVKSSQMASRLKEICIKENIKYEDKGIELICDNSNGDFRYALNKLQLIQIGNNSILTSEIAIKYSKKSTRVIINELYALLYTSTLNQLYIYLANEMTKHSIMLCDVINIFVEMILTKSLCTSKLIRLLRGLKDLDKKTTDEYNQKIHISCFIAIILQLKY